MSKKQSQAKSMVAQPLYRSRRQRDRKNDYSRKGKSRWSASKDC